MNVKTITAPTIHAALLEARRVLGDDVVLMESIPAQGEEPARITVMADSPSRSARSVDTDARKAAVHAQGASSSPSRPSPHRGGLSSIWKRILRHPETSRP